MADDNVARIRGKDGNDGGLYVLTTGDRDDSSIAVEQIKGLCELMLEHTTMVRGGQFGVEMDNALLTGINLVARLAGEVSEVLDKAPGVGGPKADAEHAA